MHGTVLLLGQVWEIFARPDALFFYLYHRSLGQFSDKSILEQGPTCSSDKGRCRCALSNLNITMEYTGEGFLFGFVAARHRSSARFEISYLYMRMRARCYTEYHTPHSCRVSKTLN